MSKSNKQECALSFKISNALKAKLDEECERSARSQSDMAKILIARGLLTLEAERNIGKVL